MWQIWLLRRAVSLVTSESNLCGENKLLMPVHVGLVKLTLDKDNSPRVHLTDLTLVSLLLTGSFLPFHPRTGRPT